ncbi:MAG: hypothetical protein V7744_19805 [Pseudomonadales bacterium]
MRKKLRDYDGLVKFKRTVVGYLTGKRGKSWLDVLSAFPIFSPLSVGNYRSNTELTIQAVNQTFPVLRDLTRYLQGDLLAIKDIRSFPKNDIELKAVEDLSALFDKFGSDKSNHHTYHYFYGAALCRLQKVDALFEVGLGTNNTDVVSNMGRHGKPGASLRAFREFLPNANIFGADIDKRILFSEEKISTFYVDQTSQDTFTALGENLPEEMDMIIDDGLHSPNANILTLKFGLEKVRVGGWVVIEDIRLASLPVWQVVSALLPENYESHIYDAEGIALFAVQRIS